MRKIMFHLNCLERGGAERVVTNLSNQFCKEGDEIIVATQWYGEEEFELDRGVRRVHVGLKETDANKNTLIKAILRVWYLRKFIQEEKPDVVVAFAYKAIYRTLIASLFIKMPVIIAVRTDPVGHYDSKLDKILIPLLYPRASGAVFQTEGQRDFFPKYIRENSCIILNPVTDKYLNVEHPAQKEKTVVHSGRLVDFKNQQLLIEAFVQVHEKHPEYDLKIYGGDSFDGTKELLEETIQKHNAQCYVHLMGSSDELEKQLIKGEVYAFSSDWEGLPNALLEAMVLGMPIVATDCPCGGPRTIMEHRKSGLLVPVKDKDALANGIIELIENPEYAVSLGNEARKLADRVNGPAIIDQWKEFIEKTIAAYYKR